MFGKISEEQGILGRQRVQCILERKRREERDFVHEKPFCAGLQEEDTWDSSESSECALKIFLNS